MKWLMIAGFLISGVWESGSSRALHKYIVRGNAQGTTYQLTYYATDSIISKPSIDSLFSRLDSSLSIYKPYSLVSQFNASNRGVLADDHLKKVMVKAQETFIATKGIFDISILPITEEWGFASKKVNATPGKYRLANLMKCVGSKKLLLKGDSLVKTKPCVRLDPNGIAQGYSADLLAEFLENKGIHNYVAEIGGEMRIKGLKENNQPFVISIEKTGIGDWDIDANPRQIAPGTGAITSSGNYRKYIQTNGKNISHIIDARTGYPARNEIISVTVYAADAITADAYDNSFMVMGLKQSLAFCARPKNIAAYFIYRKKDGTIADTCSANFPRFVSMK